LTIGEWLRRSGVSSSQLPMINGSWGATLG
jgi:hypothetical protein